MICTKYFSGYQIKKNDMGGTCSMYGGEERCCKVLVGESGLKKPLGRLDVYGRIILKLIFKEWFGEHGLDLCGLG